MDDIGEVDLIGVEIGVCNDGVVVGVLIIEVVATSEVGE